MLLAVDLGTWEVDRWQVAKFMYIKEAAQLLIKILSFDEHTVFASNKLADHQHGRYSRHHSLPSWRIEYRSPGCTTSP
jgi:hypothetical protein